MGEVKVGDAVSTPTGWSTVTGIYPQGLRTVFEIRLSDGATVQCDEDHLWEVQNATTKKTRLIHTGDLASAYLRPLFISTARAQFDPRPVPLDPYVLGVLLGHGSFRHPDTVCLSSADPEIVERVRAVTTATKCRGDNYDYRLGVDIHHAIKGLGLHGLYSHEKFIPADYKYNTETVRLEILRGLLDTDGTVDRRTGQPRLEQTSKRLAADVTELVESLGGHVRTRIKPNGRYKTVYRQSLVVENAADVFSLPRKRALAKPKKKPLRRYLKSVTVVGKAETQCIKIADERGLYLTDHCVITHNTFGLANWIIREAWNREQALLWWCAPTFKQANIAFKLIGHLLPPGRYRKRASQGEMVYELLYTDGRVRSIIDFRSADRPESLRGEGVHGAVIDEAGYWKRDSFVSVMTTLTRTEGKLRIISTPKGRNWFYEEWAKGWFPEQRKKNPEYWSYQLPTTANPFIKAHAIETLRRNFTDRQFRQEILAEFLEDGAGVFSNIKNSQKAFMSYRPIPGRRYVMGIDWAKHDDFTVFVVMDAVLKKVVYIERFQSLDWNVNIDRALRVAKDWNRAAILMDSTGVGDVPFDAISGVYANCEGYNIYNNEPKVRLIQTLQLALERGDIVLPVTTGYEPEDDPETKLATLGGELEHELMMYSSNVTTTGKIQYAAPEGYKDDMVIALALAAYKVTEEPGEYQWGQVRGI